MPDRRSRRFSNSARPCETNLAVAISRIAYLSYMSCAITFYCTSLRVRKPIEQTICHRGMKLSDLQRNIEKRKKDDPNFAANYEHEYQQFKIGVLLRELRLKEGMTQ